MASSETQPGFLKSSHSVNFPSHEALWYSEAEFENYLLTRTKAYSGEIVAGAPTEAPESATSDSQTLASGKSGDVDGLKELSLETQPQGVTFMQALHSKDEPDRDLTDMMLTDNADLAYGKTEPLVDLFFALNGTNAMKDVSSMLEASWSEDPLKTLKIIFNARSIHLGKSSKKALYQCVGWLAQNHPKTLLINLQWLCRPVIEKKVGEKRKREEEEDAIMVEAEKSSDDPSRFDVPHGTSHGYFKDLGNILVLAAEGRFGQPESILNIQAHGALSKREWDPEKAQIKRHELRDERQSKVVKAFEGDTFYTALHMTVARIFASQLRSDLDAVRSDDKKAARNISLCAKWAPSSRLFHDKHTYVVSTISELLHPQSEYPTIIDRETYLRHAREDYRRDVSLLRTKIGVVEQKIAANKFEDIKYDRIPSLAMNNYVSLFAKKDSDRFTEYISQVAQGQKRISGAVLLPSTLVSKARNRGRAVTQKGARGRMEAMMVELDAKVVDGQWKTLVQRIKDSGKMENAIAVADVSGSMTFPSFPDGSCPMDTSIGMSMLLAEVTAPPFGGSFITFSANPTVQRIQGSTFTEQVRALERSDWGMNTDFEKVFSGLILPLAKKHKVSQSDMVKKVFVFSDMNFDAAASYGSRWTTSFERIKKQYQEAGYEMPELVFWNLAAGHHGQCAKPVSATEDGVALVSGYSQGMLKVFLDNGEFADPEAEEKVEVEEIQITETGEEEIVKVVKTEKTNPASVVNKAVSHDAYSMLRVVD